jgi:catechol 2,3-dioxygenase-like lactoylglutathione lyase family enzyme
MLLIKMEVCFMLGNRDTAASIPVKDIRRARKFYEETLGLTPVDQMGEEVVVYKSGSTNINVYHSEYAGTNQATAMTWSVGQNIDSIVKELKKKGIAFEHYDMPEMKEEGDVYSDSGHKVAWFKDPDGNILSVASS